MKKFTPYFFSYLLVSIATLIFNNIMAFHSPIPMNTVVVRTSMSASEIGEKLQQLDIPKDAIIKPWSMPQTFHLWHFIYFALIFLAFSSLVRFFKKKAKLKDDDHVI